MAWTTDDLVSEVRLKAWLPTADDLSASDILSFADDEQQALISATIKTAREEHWVTSEDVAVSSSRVSIPRRALGRAVRGITAIDTTGKEQRFELVPPGEAWRFGTPSAQLEPTSGYFEGDSLALFGFKAGWSIRFRYLMRPSRLVPVSECAPVDSALSTSSVKLTGAPPDAITTPGSIVDLVSGDEPHSVRYADLTVSSYDIPMTLVLTTSPVVVADVAAPGATPGTGATIDYVCPRDCTCYPPIPRVLWSALVAATAGAIHEAQANRGQAETSAARASRSIGSARAVMEPRDANGGASIIKRSGPLRQSSGSRGRGNRWQ